MTGTSEGAKKAAEIKHQETHQQQGKEHQGRGSNLSQKDRSEGGKQSQSGGREKEQDK